MKVGERGQGTAHPPQLHNSVASWALIGSVEAVVVYQVSRCLKDGNYLDE